MFVAIMFILFFDIRGLRNQVQVKDLALLHSTLQARIIVCRKFRVYNMIRANLLLRTHFSGLNPISHVTESVTPRIRLDMVRLLVTTNLCPTTRFNHLGFSPLICLCANGLPFWITFVRNFRGFVECAVYGQGFFLSYQVCKLNILERTGLIWEMLSLRYTDLPT